LLALSKYSLKVIRLTPFCLYYSRKGRKKKKGENMPDIAKGRERVNAFLKEKGIKKATLAVAYGFKRQEVTNILSGTTKGPRANSFILQVIEDYGIE
jgi:putative DNA-binding protein